MTQYSDVVERQRQVHRAEEWAKGCKCLHTFNTKTCTVWYETRPDDGRVMDVTYNDGRIERHLLGRKKKEIIYFGERKTGDALLNSYVRHQSDAGQNA